MNRMPRSGSLNLAQPFKAGIRIRDEFASRERRPTQNAVEVTGLR
jgi:hypothetical protein